MYSYTWDAETGGLLLNTAPLTFSKEPRPVYYRELDILGFDKHWTYAKDDTWPYMWAEASTYIYRGRVVARTKGGSLYTAPEFQILEDPEPDGQPLRFVDVPAMVEKNRNIMKGLVDDTIKKVYSVYEQFRDKIDIFYVALSGGKDSAVEFDIIQRALPHGAFSVLFGDTQMEFPDTYEAVLRTEQFCKNAGIQFIRAKSDKTPECTWELFGPPATVNRWCCSVHKTSPQIIALRSVLDKTDFTGMAFVGVRADESLARSEYDYISLGEKHKGQYSCNPILEWNSAEVFLYIYTENLYLNEAYKKGNRRAGCLVCPRAAERNDFMARTWYGKEYDHFISLIEKQYEMTFPNTEQMHDFIANGGWKARKNGRDIKASRFLGYSETIAKEKTVLTIRNPKTDWKTWIKTIGVLLTDESPFLIQFRGNVYQFELSVSDNEYSVVFDSNLTRENPLFSKLLKNVFKKSASCILCRECEADCPHGCLSMKGEKLVISDACRHCSKCHKVEKGCLVYKSLEMPKGGSKMEVKSLNSYSHHAPKMNWIEQFFELKNEFDQHHSLGTQMYSFFKRFLRDAMLLDESGFTKTAEIIENLGLENECSWAILLTNLAYTAQIGWYVHRIEFYVDYKKDYVQALLVQDGAKESWAGDVWSSIGRFLELPFSQVGMGMPIKEKNRFTALHRTAWSDPDLRVILYALYKYAEACDGFYQFTLSRLMNFDIESEGVSPAQIFGLDRDAMEKLLTGLSVQYPDFINATFTLDLDNINLRDDKTSADVLELF